MITDPSSFMGYHYIRVYLAWQGTQVATYRHTPDDERVVLRTFDSAAEAKGWAKGFAAERSSEGYEQLPLDFAWTINPQGKRVYCEGDSYGAPQAQARDVKIFKVKGGGPFDEIAPTKTKKAKRSKRRKRPAVPKTGAGKELVKLETFLGSLGEDDDLPSFIDFGDRVVWGKKASKTEIAAAEAKLGCALPDDYKKLMLASGPFHVGSEGTSGAFRMFSISEVIALTETVRQVYPDAVDEQQAGGRRTKELLQKTVFFQFVDWDSVENYYGFAPDGTVRRMDHDAWALILDVRAKGFTAHLTKLVESITS